MEKKGYYAIIPASVRYDKDLSANSKLLYGEISSLCNEKGFCYASNSYFADLYSVNKSTVSRWLTLLTKKKHVAVKYIFAENSREIKERRIYLNVTTGGGIDLFAMGGIRKKINTPIAKSAKRIINKNNKYINNSNICQLAVDWDALLANFKAITGKKNTRIISQKVKKKYLSLLKEDYKKKEIITAMKNAVKDQFHIDTKFKHLTLEYFSRPTTIDRFIDVLDEVKQSEKTKIKTKEYDR